MIEQIDAPSSGSSVAARVSRWTTLDQVSLQLLDVPARGFSAWARTTGGVVAFLLAIQILTGLLLAFVYVPSIESAHATVAYTEKVLDGGSWIRAMHFYGSQWLPLALLLHLTQMLWGGAYRRKPVGWLASLLLLALGMVNGATGYSLPWDARAYFSTSVAAGIAGGLPFFGTTARSWLAGGAEISTLTLSRFYALHVLVVPAFILTVCVIRLFVLREPQATPGSDVQNAYAKSRGSIPAQLTRHTLVISLVFICLSFYALKYPAPLGPQAGLAASGYIPRPGAQFLWLFQMLKYFPTVLASLVAFLLPALIIAALALLPFLRSGAANVSAQRKLRVFGLAVIISTFLLVVSLTAIALAGDARDPRIQEQLARQTQQESEFRSTPFVPRMSGDIISNDGSKAHANESGAATQISTDISVPPPAYMQSCARCHGQQGEGRSINPPLKGVSTRPGRSLADLIQIMNDPRRYGLEARMPSFATKLSEEEKHAIAEWLVTLQ